MMREPRQFGRASGHGNRGVRAGNVPSQAYYHYVHYASRTGPFAPIYEKFDLTTADKTVTFFVSDQGPSVYAANDSFGSVLSQVKQAAAAWNSVTTSDLRVAFGGLESYSANPTTTSPGGPLLASSTPGGDVIFLDLPGVVGLGAPTTSQTPVQAANGSTFFPILRGTVMLSRDTTPAPGPSYLRELLYHRGTRDRARPRPAAHLDGERHVAGRGAEHVARPAARCGRPRGDFAALRESQLAIDLRFHYGPGDLRRWAARDAGFGGGDRPGRLRRERADEPRRHLPDRRHSGDLNYLLYVHPLPPDAMSPDESGIRLPKDPSGQTFAPGSSFQTVFYPGTLDPTQANVISVAAGAQNSGVNFTVQRRTGVPAYDLVTYCRLNTATRTYICRAI